MFEYNLGIVAVLGIVLIVAIISTVTSHHKKNKIQSRTMSFMLDVLDLS